MSLLDDVSIVVTPNGYKAGTLYGVIPVPTEGSNVVVNGDFATDSDWNKGGNWTIAGGLATRTSGSTSNISQVISGISGKLLKVSYTVSGYGGDGNIGASPNGSDFNANTGNGTYTDYITPTSDNLYIRASYSFSGSIDNVSVKEYTAADMDVTRATAGTRVDENGLVNYAEILGDSILTGNNSNFDTGIGSWVTYNGGTLAHSTDKLEVTLTTGESGARIDTNSLISGGQSGKTFKVRARIWQGTTTATALKIFIGGAQENITISSTPTYFEVELTPTSTGMLTIYRAGGAGGIGTYFIDDVTLKEVTRDNVPRIDYTGGGCPHILAEPQRTNLITYSEDFSSWNKLAAVVTTNQTTSPSGTLTADKITYDGTTYGRVEQTVAVTNGNTYSWSVYLKNNDLSDVTQVWLGFSQAGQGEFVTITNEWQRYETVQVANGSNEYPRVQFTGTGSLYAWGAQLEEGSYATSYIPTSGSTVTRNQDIFSRDGIGSLINSTEGVLFVEAKAFENGIITISNGTNNDNLIVAFNVNSGRLDVNMTIGGSYQFIFNYTTSVITNNKIAIKYKLNDFALWVNGVEVLTDTSGNTATSNTFDRLNFSSANAASQFFKGELKQLQVYTTALTDEQLTSLTT